MASPLDEDSNLVDKLKAPETKEAIDQRAEELNARVTAQLEKQQERIGHLVSVNSTVPVNISSVHVFQAGNTRRGFLERICRPLLAVGQKEGLTLLEARMEIDKVAAKLNKLGIFRYPVSVYIDKPEGSNPFSTPSDLNVYYIAKQGSWYTIKTGTEAGTAEGSVYGNAQFRNLFGGAESLNAHASWGTRTRSIYSLGFDTPILSNPDLKWEIYGFASSALKPWASHEEVLKGGWTKFKYDTAWGHRHEIGYSGTWRQITGLASNASPSVRLEAGDSFKSSITHSWINDQRDNPLLPSRGYFFKTVSELAGASLLGGDAGFGKVELETQGALPIPIPGIKGDSGVSLNAGFRAGLLYPLAAGGKKGPEPSRLSDRFQLGGPTDVRGFKMSGLGPHDGHDALGGDMYAAAGLSLLCPLPRTGKDTPLRLQAFVNGGRLLALKSRGKDGAGATMDNESVREGVKRTFQDLQKDLPSVAAGIGLVYAHPLARFELNFTLPLVMREREQARKGIQFGIGVTFL